MTSQTSATTITPRTLIIIAFTALHLGAGCTGSLNNTERETTSSSAGQTVVAATVDTVETALEKEFNLMEHSALDTCGGVFEGEYEEKVSDQITVRAAVKVYLEQGRILGIEITDSLRLDIDAARVIPRRILESQRLPVEAVSGASVGSWTIMTAVAVALEIDLTELEDLLEDISED
jgi:uncharacterized protein with FMN-binding domain